MICTNVYTCEKQTKHKQWFVVIIVYQMFPLAGASVYEHVSKNGDVTIARDPGKYPPSSSLSFLLFVRPIFV